MKLIINNILEAVSFTDEMDSIKNSLFNQTMAKLPPKMHK